MCGALKDDVPCFTSDSANTHHTGTSLYDADFVVRDITNRLPKDIRVICTNACDNRGRRRWDDICGIELAADSHFDAVVVDITPPCDEKCQQRLHFELSEIGVRRVNVRRLASKLPRRLNQEVTRHEVAVHLPTFPEIKYIGG